MLLFASVLLVHCLIGLVKYSQPLPAFPFFDFSKQGMCLAGAKCLDKGTSLGADENNFTLSKKLWLGTA